MNHLETLTTEWLDYNDYFVRTAVKVGKLEKGGYAGELDVVAFHPMHRHFLHVECSADANTWEWREKTFSASSPWAASMPATFSRGWNCPPRSIRWWCTVSRERQTGAAYWAAAGS